MWVYKEQLQCFACSSAKLWAEGSLQLSTVLPRQCWLRPSHESVKTKALAYSSYFWKYIYILYIYEADPWWWQTKRLSEGVQCFDNQSLSLLICCTSSLCFVVFHNLSTQPNLRIKMSSAWHWIYFPWPNMCSQACFQNRTAALWT